MTAGIVRIVRKLPSSPNTSGRATLTKKARAVGVTSIALHERGWKFPSDIRAAIAFCLKGRMGQSRIDRLKQWQGCEKETASNQIKHFQHGEKQGQFKQN
ncbi:hypothetical protein AVEN_197986-1 [Araneus ventricosus]|uniref:Uncharacterized protein n=1 Tax=Araneus ventricosus TaxID=182803 RepID=A0A4Y2IAI1_ARAVE|nr:hypothetical protein AVEN_197986-1 [Araneus ventricosus]